jgi:predicted secreted hydrolase
MLDVHVLLNANDLTLVVMMNLTKQLLQTLLLMVVTVYPAHTANDGYLQVTGPCRLSFPADHGPHLGYRTEWWYYTGNLAARDGHRFGFQLTFFRSQMQPPNQRKTWPLPASDWRTDQIYLAHAAITDINGQRHLQDERMARPVLSLAGAEQTDDMTTIHLHDWQAAITPRGHRLQAEADEFGLDLELKAIKPPVKHGEDGYSRKGQSPERASCYYSFTRLQAVGNLTVLGKQYAVDGSAWMDHEFSTAPLQPGITGWDWFSLQLTDQSEVMIFFLRQADETLNPASSGTYVSSSGKTRHLHREDVQIRPLSHWTSPHSGARYPVKWQVSIAALALNLIVEANFADQEMHTPQSTNVTYWEGSVQAMGTRQDKAVDGVGYVELTGYAEPFDAPM